MAGIKDAHNTNLEELWVGDGTSPDYFRATMSMKRFYLILRALRFVDKNDRHIRRATDNLAAKRTVFEDFVFRCKLNYHVGEYSTIDAMLKAFRGRCSLCVYIANKPAKYGIKIYALVDTHTFHTSNLEIYAGKQPDGPYKVDNAASSVVKRVAAPILNTGKIITMDNYVTFILVLAKELLEQESTIVGTLRQNKRDIPPLFSDTKIRPPCSSMFGFSKSGVLASYIPRRNKNMLVLSTIHSEDRTDEETGEKRENLRSRLSTI
ncbi:hypothetical protein PR048_022592 [Dryococelus australis]|uniref:PiggyBac transposable element-derived protein domain-containing protein n=1 Tax=Dryococelus australis TaxID=614101 RepID=A0ABQ9H1I3_9NEOP|nr:hypothetical protein PR048_022592 [Dryococelus australis]